VSDFEMQSNSIEAMKFQPTVKLHCSLQMLYLNTVLVILLVTIVILYKDQCGNIVSMGLIWPIESFME